VADAGVEGNGGERAPDGLSRIESSVKSCKQLRRVGGWRGPGQELKEKENQQAQMLRILGRQKRGRTAATPCGRQRVLGTKPPAKHSKQS